MESKWVRRGRRAGIVLGALIVALGVVVLAGSRGEQLAEQPECGATIAGTPLRPARSPRAAVHLDEQDVVDVTAQTAADRIALTVTLSAATDRYTWTVADATFPSAAERPTAELEIGTVANYGIGLYVVEVRTPACVTRGWVAVDGRPPVFTTLGFLGFAVATAGLVGGLVNLWRSGANGGGTMGGALGSGVLLGSGSAVVAQQAGVTPLSPMTLVAWIGLAAGGLTFLHLARRSNSLRRARLAEARRAAGDFDDLDAEPGDAGGDQESPNLLDK